MSSSNDRQAEDKIPIIPFLLNTKSEDLPSSFEIVIKIDSIRYRYGFETTKMAIVSEWLFAVDYKNSNKESNYFTRENQDIKVNSRRFHEGKGLENKTRPNALFLSTVAQLNGIIAIELQNWFRRNLNVISGLKDSTTGYTIQRFQKDEAFRNKLIEFFKLINLGIEDIQIEEKVLGNLLTKITAKRKGDERLHSLLRQLQSELKKQQEKENNTSEIVINTLHKRYNEANELVDLVSLDFGLESEGTQKLFGLLGPWLETIENGEILIIDELDARLHTKLTNELLRIFQSSINKKNAQLIFASHDTNLLRKDLFRRDQIWFTEKNEHGATDLYSLVEYKVNQATSIRNDASFEKDYLMGKYGAIPYFGDIERFIKDFSHEE